MALSPAQCRAARALLDWTQDDLAMNAQVARPTVADFERNVRTPMRNNLISMASALEAAGIAFIPDNGEGAGVRFRKVELEYSRTLSDLGSDIGIGIRVKYRGANILVIATRNVMDDMDRTTYQTVEEKTQSVARHMPKYLVAAEKVISANDFPDGHRLELGYGDFPAGTFRGGESR